MIFQTLFNKKRIFRSMQSIIIGIFVCLTLLAYNATANAGTYFGQSPSSNTIVELLRDNSGNIIAVDHQGNVMRFDYFQWTTIKGNPGFENNILRTFSYYDKATNKVVITQSNYYLVIGMYNVNTNNYDLFQVLGYPYICSSGNRAFAFIRNGDLYLISHTGNYSSTGQAKLYKYNGGSWIEISTGPDISGPQGFNSYFYDQSSDCVFAIYKASNYSSVEVKFSFKDNKWYYFNAYDGSSNDYLFQLNNNIITAYRTFQSYPTPYSIGNYQANTVYFVSSSTVATLHVNDGIFMGSIGYNAYIFYPSGIYVGYWNAGNIGFTAYSVCYDKYGNMVFGGEGGKIIVRDTGGALQTNTDFYTDYAVNIDIKQGVNNAVNAANSAAIQAQNAANNAWQAADWLNPASGSVSAVKDAGGTVLTAARQARDAANQALSALSNIQTTVNNINNTINTQDTLPPSVELDTVSGARATSSSSIQLVVAASDNKSTSLTYSVNGSPYSALPADGRITVPLPSIGPNTITVRVKDEAGNTAVKTIKIWRLG